MNRRDLIVVGASAGGIETISRLLGQLPVDLPAAVLIVQHVSASSPTALASIFDQRCALPVETTRDGDKIRAGKVYVAPPDLHLLVKMEHLQVSMGPKENRFRPAIDPLFRSAAAAYGSRVIGIVLSGLLDDGAAGLLAIRRCNGTTVIQEPADAFNPQMPENAARVVNPDYCLPVARRGELLTKLTSQPAKIAVPIPEDIQTEAMIACRTLNGFPAAQRLGELVPISCPECGGPLRELNGDQFKRYRCEVGHAYTQRTLLEEQRETIERTLWIALRAFEEKAHLHESMAHQALCEEHEDTAENHKRYAEQSHGYVEQLKKILQAKL